MQLSRFPHPTEPVSPVEGKRRTSETDNDDLLAGEDRTLELAWAEQSTADLEEENKQGSLAARELETHTHAGAMPPQASTAATTLQDQGKVLHGRYRLEQAVAIGGSSIIYRATDLRAETDPTLPAAVAVKIIRPDLRHRSAMNERLKREFGYTASLRHSSIVRVFDLDSDEDVPFFTMEYLPGEPLNVRLQRQRENGLPATEALRILRACGAALAYAHERGVLHCDFKPSNVLLMPEGEVKVLDFGAACAFTSDLGPSAKKPESATPAYASPQLLAAERPDVRDDVFSLACVAYELFSGRHPFGGMSAVEMFTRGKSLVRPASLNDSSWHAIENALRIEREARPANVGAFLDAFAEREPRSTRRTAPSGKRFLPAIVLVALGIVIGSWLQPKHEVSPLTAKLPKTAATSTDIEGIQQAIANYNETLPSALVSDALRKSTSLVVPSRNKTVSFAAARQLSTGVIRHASADTPTAAKKRTKAVADGMVTLEQPRLEVSPRALAAVLTLRRTGTPNGRVLVQWRTQAGTARPAQDFEPVADGSVWLADGQSTRALFIPLKPTATHDGRAFTVELKDAKGAALGGVTRTVVTIR